MDKLIYNRFKTEELGKRGIGFGSRVTTLRLRGKQHVAFWTDWAYFSNLSSLESFFVSVCMCGLSGVYICIG